MTLRATARLLSLLGVRPATLPGVPPSEHDWYGNLLWIDRRKCVLLVHAETLFPIFVADARKADLTPLGPWLTAAIEDHLRSERIPTDALGPLDPKDVLLAKTTSRSILGVMNEIAHDIHYQVAAMGELERTETAYVNHFIRRTLHGSSREYMTPLDRVERRLG